MATRWPSSSRAVAACLTALALAAGCVTTTKTYFVPTAGESRLDQDEFRDASDQVLRVECPRLMGTGNFASGQARVRVEIDRAGAVQRAEITRASGDKQIDAMWGALAARLAFDPQAGQKEDLRAAIITVGYSCGPGTAVTTLQL